MIAFFEVEILNWLNSFTDMLLAPVSYLVIFRCYCIIKWYQCWILGNLYVSITELLLSDYYSVLWLLINLCYLKFTFLPVDRKWGPGQYCWKFHLLPKQASRLRIGGNRFLINPMFLRNRYLYPCFLLDIWFSISYGHLLQVQLSCILLVDLSCTPQLLYFQFMYLSERRKLLKFCLFFVTFYKA